MLLVVGYAHTLVKHISIYVWRLFPFMFVSCAFQIINFLLSTISFTLPRRFFFVLLLLRLVAELINNASLNFVHFVLLMMDDDHHLSASDNLSQFCFQFKHSSNFLILDLLAQAMELATNYLGIFFPSLRFVIKSVVRPIRSIRS